MYTRPDFFVGETGHLQTTQGSARHHYDRCSKNKRDCPFILLPSNPLKILPGSYKKEVGSGITWNFALMVLPICGLGFFSNFLKWNEKFIERYYVQSDIF